MYISHLMAFLYIKEENNITGYNGNHAKTLRAVLFVCFCSTGVRIPSPYLLGMCSTT
jgi:hypothetical protein